MKYTYLLWIWACCTSMSYAQSVTITDRESAKPIEGVVLLHDSLQTFEVTDQKGQADISAFLGAESIIIRTLGYQSVKLSYSQILAFDLKIELEKSNLNLDEVVVSATRWRQYARNVPSTITSISSKEVALINPQTAADLLGISGKVFIQKSQQGGGSPMIRGFATNRLIYTVDGVRMNNAIFRGGNLQNVISLDPFAVENTEVLFGPGSVIYGSDAIGGVMSFQTLSPKLSLDQKPRVSGKALARYSSANNEKTGHVDVNVGWSKWAMVTSFSSWDYDHLRQGNHGPEDYIKNIYPQRQDSIDVIITQEDPLLQIPSAYSQVNFMQKIRFEASDRWGLQYGFHYSETSPYGRYDRHNRFRDGTLRYAEWNYGPQKWMMNNLSITHQGNSLLYDELCLRVAHQAFEESRIDRSLHRATRTTNTEKVKAYSVNLDFKKDLDAKHTLHYGAEYVLNKVASDGKRKNIATQTEHEGPARYPNSTWKSVAIYMNDEWKLSEKWTLQSGIRYNQFGLDADFANNAAYYPFPFSSAEINNGALTGSLGAVFRPNEKWALKSNFGTAFRAPNVDDIGKVFDSEPGAVVVPNTDLKGEYAYNIDFGVAKVFGDWLKLEATGYYTLLENALIRRDHHLGGEYYIAYDGQTSRVQAILNAAEAHVVGVQTGVEIKLPYGYSFLSDLNYQVGTEELEDGTSSASRHAAPLYGVSRLRYLQEDLTIEFYANYQGEISSGDLAVDEQNKDEIYAKDEKGKNYAPSWHTLNFKAMYQLTETISISGGIENLADRRYRPYSSGLSGSGRNMVLSVRATI